MNLKKHEMVIVALTACLCVASLILAVWSKIFYLPLVLFVLSFWMVLEYQKAHIPTKTVFLRQSSIRTIKVFFEHYIGLEKYKKLVWRLCIIFFALGFFAFFIGIFALVLGSG